MRLFFLALVLITYSCAYGQERLTLNQVAEKASIAFDIAMSYGNIGKDTVDITVSFSSEEQFLKSLRSLRGYEVIALSEKEYIIRKEETQRWLELRCVVLSSISKEPLELAMIGFPQTGKAVYTDKQGQVVLRVKEEELDNQVEISMVGFKKITTSVTRLKDDPKVLLDVLSMDVEEVIIEDKLPVVSIEETGGMGVLPGSELLEASQIAGGDVLRSLQFFAGVAAFQDNTSTVAIRGSNYDQTMITIDQVPVYGKGHYFGLFSAINPLYTKTINLYKNNLPPKYGGRNAGLVEIESVSRQDFSDISGEVELSLLSSAGVISIPFTKNVNLHFGGRTSFGNVNNKGFISLFESQVDQEGNIDNFTDLTRETILSDVPDFSFYDVNANLSYSSERLNLDFDIYKSVDNLSQEISSSFTERRMIRNVQSTETYINDEDWNSEFLAFSAEYLIRSNLTLSTSAYTSSYSQSSLTINRLTRKTRINERDFDQEFAYQNGMSERGITSELSLDITKQSKVETGVDFINYETSINSSDRIAQRVRFGGEINIISGFVDYKSEYIGGWLLDAGLRYSYHNGNDENYLSPRFSFGKKVDENFVIKSSVGRQFQFARVLDFESLNRRAIEIWSLGGNNGVPVGRVDQVMLGFQFKKDRFLFDVEGYRKWTDGLLNIALDNPFISGSQVIPEIRNTGYRFFLGDGDIYGVDITLGYTGKKYGALLSYTLSKSTESYSRIAAGAPIPSSLDRRHQFSLAHSYDFGKWSLSSDVIWVSGRPYLDLEKLETDVDRNDQIFATSISRLPAYVRLDIGVGYELSMGGREVRLRASLVNMFDRQNVNYIQYTFALPEGAGTFRNRGAVLGNTANLLDRTLNLSASVKF